MEFNLNLPLTSAIAVTTSLISRTVKQSLEEKSFTVSTGYQLWQLKKTIYIVIIIGSRVMKKKY